jgi:hypothetical protein
LVSAKKPPREESEQTNEQENEPPLSKIHNETKRAMKPLTSLMGHSIPQPEGWNKQNVARSPAPAPARAGRRGTNRGALMEKPVDPESGKHILGAMQLEIFTLCDSATDYSGKLCDHHSTLRDCGPAPVPPDRGGET